MADTYTTNLNLTKPEPGAAEDTWGISLNADLDSLDAIFSTSGTQINLNPNQINFADGKKLILGTGSDLEIYHDGSNSYIKDTGTGTLRIQGSSSILMQKLDGEIMMIAREDGAVELNHNGSQKIKTTSTGVNVTGTVNTDSLTVTGDIEQTTGDLKYTGGINWDIAHHGASQNIVFKTTPSGGSATEVMRIRHDGNIGIGTASPSNPLTVLGADSMAIDDYIVHYGDSNTKIGFPSNDKFKIRVAGSDIATVTSTGLGIGTSSPQGNLHVEGAAGVSGGGIIYVTDADNGSTASDALQISKSGDTAFIYNRETSGNLQLGAGGNANHMIVRTDGKVGIGTTSPQTLLHLSGANPEIRLSDTTNTNYNGIKNIDGNMIYMADSGSQIGNSRHRWEIDGSEKMRLHMNGYLGIGTTSPAVAIHAQSWTAEASRSLRLSYDGTYYFDLRQKGSGGIVYNAVNASAGGHRWELDGYEKARIDSTGLGIGTTSPTRALDVSKSGSTILANFKNTGGTSSFITLGNTTSTADQIRVGSNGTALTFSTNYAEVGRFDASGNFLCGTTNTTPAFGTGNGTAIRTGEMSHISRSGGTPLALNRASSDGDILSLRKDGSTVGSINALSGDLAIGTGDTGVRFHDGTNSLFPVNTTTNANVDDSINIGHSTARFKDLHLSGTANADSGLQVGSIGNIGNRANDVVVYSSGAGHNGLRFHVNGILPTDNTGAIIDDDADLGIGTHRFQDLYLSGAAYTGGQLKGSAGSTTKTIINATSTTTELHAAGTTGTVFKNNGDAEKARLDGNGNFLVGKTGAGTNTAGAQIDSTGRANFTVDANFGLLVNRKTSDGEIARFQKDGSTVGSIGVDNSNNLYIQGDTTNSGLQCGTNAVLPHQSGADVDATIALGGTTRRFTSLHISDSIINDNASGVIKFRTNGSERGRFDASGNLLVGKTSASVLAEGVEARPNGTFSVIRDDGQPMYVGRKTSDGTLIDFRKDGATVGSVSVTSSATTYNTTSDARLKDVTGEARGLEVITKLNPVAYNWKADGKADEGLIAQEVKELVPNAVTGSEDEHYQMDYSKLVTHLVKGMKEQQEQIEFLKEEIANLKGE